MKIREIKNRFNQSLKSIYTANEIDIIFYTLAEKYLKKKKSILRMALDEEWSEVKDSLFLFEGALLQLRSGQPYQQVVGETEFMGNRIFINKDVLIPRPETEELVEWIINDYKNKLENFNGNFLDIGTGSGAIAITLKKAFPNSVVHALDISKEAIEVAKNNAMYNQTKIHFHTLDIMNTDLSHLPFFDIIVSNPPYIPESEKSTMDKNVVDHEPHLALFVSDEAPTSFYFQISQLAQDRLKPHGRVYLEIHQDLADQNRELFEYGFAKVELKKDISNNWRMLRAEQPYTCK